METRVLCFQASVFLTSSKYANQDSGWQEPQHDHMNSLHVDKDINSLWLRSNLAHTRYTQGMLSIPYSEKFLPSPQWTAAFRNPRNCGTPWSTQEYSLRDKMVHLSFMELNTQNQSESRLFFKVTLGIKLSFTHQWWQIEQEISYRCTHTHTHTHTNTKWLYPNCYLLNKYLNFYLLNSNDDQDQKSLNTRTPWCIPFIHKGLKRNFNSRSLMHA
jgi:hypothetical protein